MAKQLINSCFDFSSAERFLEIISILDKDKMPTARQWSRLINTPGYKLLFGEQYFHFPNIPDFKRQLKIGFMPSKQKERERILKDRQTSNTIRYRLRYFKRIKSNLNIIRKQIDFLKRTPIEEKAIAKALEWLPKHKLKQIPVPTYFIIFIPDAYAYKNHIFVDVLKSRELKSKFILLLAHEYYHIYRKKFTVLNWKRVNINERRLVEAIDNIQNEGTADFIDKDSIHKNVNAEANWKNYCHILSFRVACKTPNYMKDMDHILSKALDSSENRKTLGKKLWNLIPFGGHPIGFYMGNIIRNQLGKKVLIENAGNPFAFFYRYNEAALLRNKNDPIFSSKTIEFIKMLEKKYSGKL